VTVRVQGLPSGVTAAEVIIPKGQQEGKLTLNATSEAPTGPLRLEVIGPGKRETSRCALSPAPQRPTISREPPFSAT